MPGCSRVERVGFLIFKPLHAVCKRSIIRSKLLLLFPTVMDLGIGQINKLKWTKRSMFGRGSFELLRQWVLNAACVEYESCGRATKSGQAHFCILSFDGPLTSVKCGYILILWKGHFPVIAQRCANTHQ